MKSQWLVVFTCLLFLYGCIENREDYDLYTIELDVWGIYNDGTHPMETTKGINEALQWAHEQGYSTVKVPNGVYTIQASEPYDPEGRINLVSDIVLLLEEKAIFQKEANGFERYELFYIGPMVENVTIEGGSFVGDRNEHDYSKKDHEHSAGTHENGYGILIEGARNITISNVLAEQFTGDGLAVGGKAQYIGQFTEFEQGRINESGESVDDEAAIRTKERMELDDTLLAEYDRTILLSRPAGLPPEVKASLYFFDEEGAFISKVENHEIDWSLTKVPLGSKYVHITLDTTELEAISVELWAKIISENIIIKDSEFAHNRRQGITVGGVDGIEIYRNTLHSMNGTAPQSGIDVEAGFFPNQKIEIRENHFYQNASYDLILYDGRQATVEDNYFGSEGAIGLAISEPFNGAVIRENTFDGSSIHASHNAKFYQNDMFDGLAVFTGPEIVINGFELENSQLVFNSQTPFGVEGKNIVMKHEQKGQGLVINGEPIHLQNVTIEGEGELRNVSGNVKDGSIFEQLTVTGYNAHYGIDLPRGEYKNCQFIAGVDGEGEIHLNLNGTYMFKDCSVTTNGRALVIDHAEAEVEIDDSKFTVLEGGAVIYVHSAKKLELTDSQLEANNQAEQQNIIHILSPQQRLQLLLTNNHLISNSANANFEQLEEVEGLEIVTISNNRFRTLD